MALITDSTGNNILAITAAGQAPVITSQITAAAAMIDNAGNPTTGTIAGANLLFNGTNWDRARGNMAIALDALTSRTASFNGATLVNFNGRSAMFEIRATAWSGTGTFTAKVQQSFDGGTTWLDIPGAVTPSISAIGSTILIIDRDMIAAANSVVPYPLARHLRINYTWSGTLAATVGCFAQLLV